MKNLKPEFDFDDILIIPKVKTHIKSRYQGISLPKTLPLFTAPMDTVVNETNYKEFLNAGIGVTLPRTIKHNHVVDLPHGVFLSMGFDDIDFELKSSLRNIRDNEHILIDVANGHMQRVFDYCREIKRLRPDIILMVGNIANPDTYTWYAKGECVDYIRV
jgi:GMP reductase